MEHKLLIDTWGWLTLRDKKEARHHEVADFYRHFRLQGGFIYTTDYILDETFTIDCFVFPNLPNTEYVQNFTYARQFFTELIY